MAKTVPDCFDIKFHGTDKVLTGVRVVPVVNSKQNFVHLEHKGNCFLLLVAQPELLNQLTMRNHMKIACKTIDDQTRLLESKHLGDITVSKGVRCLLDKPFMHLDELDDKTWRWSYSNVLFDTTTTITEIELIKVPK